MSVLISLSDISVTTKLLCFIAISFSIWFVLKYAIRRRKYSRLIFSRRQHFIDIWGDLNTFPMTYNGYSVNTYMFQFMAGFYELFKNKDVFLFWSSYVPYFLINTPEAVEEALKGTQMNEKAWFYDWIHSWLGEGLLTSHGKKWKSRRRIITPSFHFDILKDFIPIINDKSMILVKKLKNETTNDFTNIIEHVTLCSLDIICETTLGININAQEDSDSEYVMAVRRVTDSYTGRFLNFWSWYDFTHFLTVEGRKYKKDLNLLHAFTKSVIQKKKKEIQNKISERSENKITSKRKPLIDVLLEHYFESGDINEEGIREEVDTITFEGHDTTAMGMVWSLYLIGLYPEIQNKVHEELDYIFGEDKTRPVTTDDLKDMKYLECVLKESLRLYPSAPFIGRKTDQEINIRGVSIPRGVTVLVSPYHMHRNEKIFPNPEIFNPNRFTIENSTNRHPYAYIPFSVGPRNCIGQRFAIMEEKIIVANILRNFRIYSLDPRDKIEATLDVILRPAKPVRIKFSHR